VQQLLDSVRDRIAVIRPPEFNRFQHSFSHIFAGGYAAGYYSYKWAEVLSADAYSALRKPRSGGNVISLETGRRFQQEILAVGGPSGHRVLQGLPWPRAQHRCLAAA
jgi:oligopeptidase A